MRLQVAFDYLMVFTFVLIVFTLMFISIARQRIEFSNQQSFAQLQIVAQTISTEINNAGQSGNGYNGTFQLPNELSLLQYTVAVTRYGSVIVSSNVFGQNVQAVAPGSQYIVASSPTYLQLPGNYYVIPTYNGTGLITLQNSYGTVCIDYSCPASSNQVSQISLSYQTARAPYFSGSQSDYIIMSNPMTINTFEYGYTVSAWIYTTKVNSGDAQAIFKGVSNNYADFGLSLNSPGTDGICGWINGICGSATCGALTLIIPNNWYDVVGVWGQGSTTYAAIYVNGKYVGNCSGSSSYSGTTQPEIGSGADVNGYNTFFQGYISNIQIYNTSLSANQIGTLYGEGITGTPVISANVLGWWPLNGNAQDYSGNGNNGIVTGSVIFPGVAQLSASAINSTGKSMAGELIGFSSSIGNFIAGPSVSNITDVAGNAKAVMTQASSPGHAAVTATAFNGNYSTSNNLVGWWPLNEGQGSYVYDISPQSSNAASYSPGNIFYASWASPRYVTRFDGQSGYAKLPTGFLNGVSSFTISYWINSKDLGSSGTFWQEPTMVGVDTVGSGSGDFGITSQNGYLSAWSGLNTGGDQNQLSSSFIDNGQWHNVAFVDNGVAISVYMDGINTGMSMTSNQGPITSSYAIFVGASDSQDFGSVPDFFYQGSMANLQIYGAALSSAQIQSLYNGGIASPPPSAANVIGWWPLNGDTLDYSGNGNNATAFGNVNPIQYSTPQSSTTQIFAAQFNGASSYIDLGTGRLPSGASPFTLTGWIKNGTMTTYGGAFSYGTASNAEAAYIGYVDTAQSGTPNSIGGGLYGINYGSGVSDNNWHLVALTYSGSSSGTMTLYVDGVSKVTGTTTSNIVLGSSYIGKIPGSPSYWYNGLISNVQIYNTSLSVSQIQALYTNGISGLPLSGSGLSGWWPLDGDANDYSNNKNNGVPNAITYNSIELSFPYQTTSMSGSGLYFNGATSYVSTGASGFPTGGSSRSSFAWVYYNGGSGFQMVQSYGGGSTGWNTQGAGAALGINLGVVYFTGYADEGKSTLYVPIHTWSLIGYTYNSVDPTHITLYLNGQSQTVVLTTGALNTVIPSSNPSFLGALDGCSGSCGLYFSGSIADVQLYNIALTPAQVSQLYNAGAPPSQMASVPLGVT